MRLFDYLQQVQWIQYSPDLARKFTPEGSILLCWVIWRTREQGANVEADYERIMKETGLTEFKIDTARGRLKGILESEYHRLYHKMVYRVNPEALEKAWESIAGASTAPLPEGRNPTLGESGNPTFAGKDVSSLPEGRNPTFDCTVRTGLKKEELSPAQPGGVAVAKPRSVKVGKKSAGNPEHALLVEAWMESFEAHFGQRYDFQGGKDAAKVTALLGYAGSAANVMKVATAAWSHLTGFWSKRASSLSMLESRWNEIRAELAAVGKAPLAGTAGVPLPDWVQRINAEVVTGTAFVDLPK